MSREYEDAVKASEGREKTVSVQDVSASMGSDDWQPTRLAGGIEAEEKLIREKADRYPADEVGIVSYDIIARVVHPLARVGSHKEELLKALEDLSAGGGTNITAGLGEAEKLLCGDKSASHDAATNLLDAMSTFLFGEDVGSKNKQNRGGNQNAGTLRIILLTDGKHRTGPSPVIIGDALKRRGIVIDCIGIGGSPDEVEEEQLKKLASKGPDGRPRYWFIGDKAKLIKKYEELSRHIKPA